MLQNFLRLCAVGLALVFCSHASAQQQPPPPAPNPCPSSPESRQFDFWVGEWDVTVQGQRVASSRIERAVGDCVIVENYTQPGGYHGKSLNFYDAALGKWRQTWADSTGGVSEFTGVYKDGAMRFEGETHRADGKKILSRMTIHNLGADRVRQATERSVDGGKTWAFGYDFTYLRKK